jgi:uncharacterized membrane protein
MAYTTQRQQRIESDVLRTGVLITAVMTTGLVAGVFADWSNAIMPGLREVDDRTFVAAFQALDAAITNPLFLGGFTGALLLIGLSAALHLRAGQRPVLIWIGAALVFYLMAFVITFSVHEPLNEQLRTAGGPGLPTGLAAVRAQLDEARWTAWNTARAVTSTIAFGCLTWTLVIRGRLARRTNLR